MKSWRIAAVISLSLLLLVFENSCSSTKESDYFPLVHASTYTYQFSFEGGIVQSGEDTITVVGFTKNNINGYYFIDKKDLFKESALLSTGNFGLGGYYRKDNKLYTIELTFLESLEEIALSQLQLMLEFPLKKGEKKEIAEIGSDGSLEISFMGYESVIVPAGTFEKCAKIRTKGSDGETGFVWLAPNIGMVKWQRSTGRIDQLKSYKIPSK